MTEPKPQETQEQPAAEQPPPAERQAIATLAVVFFDDGTMSTHVEGLRSNHAWAAAGLLRLMGDNLFVQQQAAAQAKRDAVQSRIAVPRGVRLPR